MTDDIVRTLRRAGARSRRIAVQRSEASSQLAEAVRAADSAGLAKTTIAREAGVSRQTVHDMIREDTT